MSLDVIVPILVAVVMSAGGWASLYLLRGKSTVDVAQAYKTMATEQVEEIRLLKVRMGAMETQIDDLECELSARDKVLIEWQAGITILTAQIVAQKMIPVWKPKSKLPARRSGGMP